MSARKKSRPALDQAAIIEGLIGAAMEARLKAYAPYSNYLVGAALLTGEGRIYTGCNVENSTYGATICAERTAAVKMVSAGEREPIACAVVTGGTSPGSPCGICRQVLAEFALDMPLFMVAVGPRGKETRLDTTLATLLPNAFRLWEHAEPATTKSLKRAKK